MTRRQLVALAKKAGIRARSRMAKDQLVATLLSASTKGQTELQRSEELPARYGRTSLTLMEIEPYWVYAYWEVTLQDSQAVSEQLGAEGKWVLRFYDITCVEPGRIDEVPYFDLPVDLEAGSWYINLWSGGKSYCAELGLVSAAGLFIPGCRSNTVHIPPAGPAPDAELRWLKLESGLERAVEVSDSESVTAPEQFPDQHKDKGTKRDLFGSTPPAASSSPAAVGPTLLPAGSRIRSSHPRPGFHPQKDRFPESVGSFGLGNPASLPEPQPRPAAKTEKNKR